MTAFVAICALFLAAAIGLLAWPLIGKRRPDRDTPKSPVAATIVAAALPVAAFLVYFWSSNWDWSATPQAAEMSGHDIQQAVARLQEKLAQEPEDVEGWKLLGRSATIIGNFPLARDAFHEAYVRTQGRDADAVAGYAESMVMIDEHAIDGDAAPLFERALELEPENPRALWYGGITAYRRGDLALAQQRWVELQNQDLPGDLRQILADRLAELERAQGKPAPISRPPPAAAPASAPASVAAGAGAVDVTIGISPALAARIPPNAMLFVIARRGSGGPPLAVQRHPVGGWPLKLRISDADAMLPGTQIASGGPITLIARISVSGQPVASSGDLFGEVGYDFTSAKLASITIDRIVP
jgi:cytochrome c-type biogenesis protein CcmH